MFGDFVLKTYNGGGHNGSPSVSLSRTKRIVTFSQSGFPNPIIAKVVGAGDIDDNPAFFSQPGRFVSTKPTIDFAESTSVSQTNGATGQVTTTTTKSIVKTDAALAMTAAACNLTAPVGYQEVCYAIPSGQTSGPPAATITDADGDGIDTINPNNGLNPFIDSMVGVGDFLGGGRQQPLFARAPSSVIKGGLSSGSWKPNGASFPITCFRQDGPCVLGDLNGDGATDLFRYKGSDDTASVWLSTGVGFKNYSVSSIAGNSAVLRDFDNDGRMDVITIAGDAFSTQPLEPHTVRAFSLRPSSTSMTPVQFTLPASIMAGVTIGDFNGDGLPDFTNYSTSMFISNAGTGNPNLLRQVTTELGGTVAVEYASSSTWANNYLPQVVHAVTKLSVGDGRGQTAVSTYTYAGGKYDPAARKFLGFASIVETKPLANGETAPSKIETTYRQDLASFGLPSLTVWKDGAGVVHKQVAETYAVNTTAKPYTVQNTATDTTLTENVARS